jgi:hypothetical protein
MVNTINGREVTLRVVDYPQLPLAVNGTVSFSYSSDGTTWVTIAEDVEPVVTDYGLDTESVYTEYTWVVNLDEGNYQIRYLDNSTGEAIIEELWVVPTLQIGQSKTFFIVDMPLDLSSTVDIELSRDGGDTWVTIAEDVEPTVVDFGLDTESVVTSYEWVVSGDLSDACLVRYLDNSDGTYFTEEQQFAIIAASGSGIVVSGSLETNVDFSGDCSVSLVVVGDIFTTSIVAGGIDIVLGFGGNIQTESSYSGVSLLYLSGGGNTSSQSSVTSGDLLISNSIVGDFISESSVFGDVNVLIGLVGGLVSLSNVNGLIDTDSLELTGDISSQSSVIGGNLTLSLDVSGILGSDSSLEGTIDTDVISVFGVVSSQSSSCVSEISLNLQVSGNLINTCDVSGVIDSGHLDVGGITQSQIASCSGNILVRSMITGINGVIYSSSSSISNVIVSINGNSNSIRSLLNGNILPTVNGLDWNQGSSMANGWFSYQQSAHDNESALYEILMTDCYNQYGYIGDYYIATFSTSADSNKLFGEDSNRYFHRKFPITLHGELPKEDQLWSRFMIESIDNFQMFCTKRNFSESSSQNGYTSYVPKVGDIIYFPHSNRFYEVIDVGQEEEMFLQRKHTWVFTLSEYKDTNISLSADTSATMGELSAYTDQEIDSFDISDFIDNQVSAFDYDTNGEVDGPNSIWGEF